MKSTINRIERNKSLNMKIKDRYSREKVNNKRKHARSEQKGTRTDRVATSHRHLRSDMLSDLASSLQMLQKSYRNNISELSPTKAE